MSLKVNLAEWPYVGGMIVYTAQKDEKPLPKSVRYDFTPVLDELYPAVEAGEDDNVGPLIGTMMPIQHLRSYLAEYFGTDFFGRMERVWLNPEHKPPGWLYLNEQYPAGYKSKHIKKDGTTRLSDRYMLTEAETAEARKVYRETPMLQMVVASLQSGILSYLSGMEGYNRHIYHPRGEHASSRKAVTDMLKIAQDVAGAFSMMHDLMPVIAFSMARDGWTPSQKLTEEIFSRGLSTAFRKSAFRTSERQENTNVLVETRCPFTRIIGHLFNTAIEEDAEGMPHVAEGVERPGSLPVYVAGRLEAHYGADPRKIPSLVEILTFNQL